MRALITRPARALVGDQGGFSMVEMLAVVGVLVVVTAMVVPVTQRTVESVRSGGDARGIANYIALAKMRAASDFTHARVFVDLSDNTYYMQTWQKTGTPGWVTEGGTQTLSSGVTFGFGSLAAAPPNTQGTIAQAPMCEDDTGTAIGNTACVVFNSRGVPIDDTGTPTGVDAIYLTDGTAVYGTTVSATGLTRFWWSPASAATWSNQ
ncbi:MAG: hypothetical protein KGN76_12930 [Acidobacteriota bacterium]|nr:hypothetical protein [Acidobacteriota bacterium]